MDKIRLVASLADLRRQIDQLDRQLMDLLARRTKLMKGVLAQTDDEVDPDWQEQVLSNWLEQAFDFDADRRKGSVTTSFA
jgi:chorismate mutase